MKFWDSSAILPLCLREPRTAALKNLVEKDKAMVAWWVTPTEGFSAFARLRREGILTSTGEEQARFVLMSLATEWTEVVPSTLVRERAARALLIHPLRAADALQLAAALVWANGHATGYSFVCLDQRLRAAARQEGLGILPQ